MTDNEIIKALETCVKLEDCEKCPRYKNCEFFYDRDYVGVPDVLALSLDINKRQKAEIERLKGEVEEKTETIDFLKNQAVGWSIDLCNLKAKFNTAKSEARKEFAKRLKDIGKQEGAYDYVSLWDIDNLLKEMERKNDR